MKKLQGNAIFAAVLIALLVIMVASLVADILVAPKGLEKNVFIVDGVEVVSSGKAPEADVIEPVTPLLPTADPVKGKEVAKKCVQCHSFEKGGPNKIGPDLWDVVGNDKATKPGFSYSAAALKMPGVWTYENLNHFLYKPTKFMPGTKMSFAGLKKVEDRANLIAYMRSLSDAPKPL